MRKKAAERLAAAADTLMAALLKIAASAESEAVRLAAIKDALDRAGFGATQMVKLAQAQPWDDFLSELLTEEVLEVTDQRKISPSPFPVGVSEPEDTTDEDNRTAMQYVDDEILDAEVVQYETPSRNGSNGTSAYARANFWDGVSDQRPRPPRKRRDPTAPPQYLRDDDDPEPAQGSTEWSG